MTNSASVAGHGSATGPDPFVTQVTWVVAAAGGKEQLVQRSGGLVSVRTLDNWTAGSYPRTKVTGAVRELDGWAREHLPGYPEAAGVPSLVESCGPYRTLVTAAGDSTAPMPRRPARWRNPVVAAAALLTVAAVSVFVTIAVVRADDGEADDEMAAAQELVDVPLPSTGDGALYTELSGSIGANTFADPRTLQDRGASIPPNTEIQVRCRYYAPSVPSVTPDGFWYLIESDSWNGRWTPANSFMNGDVPGGPYIHNTDFAVPVCH